MNSKVFRLMGSVLGIAVAHGVMASASRAQEPFDLSVIGFEVGSLSEKGEKNGSTDFELQTFIDYTGAVSWEIHSPSGEEIFSSALGNQAQQQGGSELYFASQPNHPYDPIEYPGETLDSFLNRFPAGAYTVTGVNKDGDRLESLATLTHRIPAHPDVDVRRVEGNVRLSWPTITTCFEDVSCNDFEIAEYSVKLSEAVVTRGGVFSDGGFTNGDARYLETLYAPAAICNGGLCEVTISSDFFVEGDTYEWQVFAVESSGNSTYRESDFDYGMATESTEPIGSGSSDPLSFDLATIGLEVGSLSEEGQKNGSTDFELQAFADYTGAVSWQIHNPSGEQMFSTELTSQAREQGGSEVFFASQPNHPYDPVEYPGETLDSFLKRFPAGAYKFTGVTKDGDTIESIANLSHQIPAHPDVEVRQVGDRVTLSWQHIANCFDDIPCTDPEIAEYSVKLSETEDTREGVFIGDGFTNGDVRFSESHYLPEAICDDGLCEVNLSSDFFLGGNTYEWEVFAIERTGNSTYRSSEFIYATAVPEPAGFAMGWFALLAGMMWMRHAGSQ